MNRGFWRLQASLQVGLSPRLWLCIFPNSWRQGCKNSAHAARALETSFRSLQLSRNVGKDAFEHAEHDNTFFQNNASGFYFTIVFNIMSTEEVLACCRPHAPFFCPSSLGFTGDVRRTLTQINSLTVSILSSSCFRCIPLNLNSLLAILDSCSVQVQYIEDGYCHCLWGRSLFVQSKSPRFLAFSKLSDPYKFWTKCIQKT